MHFNINRAIGSQLPIAATASNIAFKIQSSSGSIDYRWFKTLRLQDTRPSLNYA